MKIDLSDHGAPPPGLAALQQTRQYARALAAMGVRVQGITGRLDDGIAAQALVVRRRMGPLTLNWLPRGPIWRPGLSGQQRDTFLACMTGVMSGGAFWIGSADSDHAGAELSQHGFRTLIAPQSMAELDLLPSASERLAAQHCKWRNRLRHAQGAGLVVSEREFDPTRDAAFLRREAQQRRDRGYRALPLGFAVAYSAQNPGEARIWSAQKAGELAAKMLVLHHGTTATYHIGWTGELGRKTSAHNLLLWQAQNWLTEVGVRRLDLGPVDVVGAAGLARFKLGSGAALCALGPTMIRFPRAALFPKRHRAVA